MSITHRNDDPVATIQLDFEQRAALRDHVAVTSDCGGDISNYMEAGNREDAVTAVENLRGMIALLDAIGWSEPSDAPHIQQVDISASAAWWATLKRPELASLFTEEGFVVHDDDLLALAAYDAILAAVA